MLMILIFWSIGISGCAPYESEEALPTIETYESNREFYRDILNCSSAYEQLAQTACRTAATSTADDILVSESRGIVTVDGAGTVANLDELKQGYLSFLEQCQFSPRRLEIQKSHGKAIVILDKVVAEQEDQDSYLQLMIYYFEDEQQSQKGLFEGCEKIAPHWYYDIMGLV